jgi:hypothetical protein
MDDKNLKNRRLMEITDDILREMAEKYMIEESYGDPQPDLYVGFLAGFKAAIKLITTKINED